MEKKLGLTIKAQRVANDLKIYELAEKVGVSPEFITMIERGNRLPSAAVVKKLSQVLNIDLQSTYLEERHPDIVKYLANTEGATGKKRKG
jgi:transcriptional regulator with XRE-family HTH domain